MSLFLSNWEIIDPKFIFMTLHYEFIKLPICWLICYSLQILLHKSLYVEKQQMVQVYHQQLMNQQ